MCSLPSVTVSDTTGQRLRFSESLGSHASLQQHVPAIGGSDLYRGDLVDRHRRVAAGGCGDVGERHPGGQLAVAAVATHNHHRQLVAGFDVVVAEVLWPYPVSAVDLDVGSPVVAVDRLVALQAS